jgi:hypothetical protein
MPIAELVSLERAGKRLRPVFIVGEARSGTSLLFRLLQQQPAFGPTPPQLSETAFMRRLLSPGDLDDQSCWKLRTYLLDDAGAWERFKRVAAPLLVIRRAALAAAPRVYAHPLGSRVLGARSLARIYLAIASEARGVNRLVEKTPSAAEYTGQLLDWFPGAVVLYIHRHPVDVLSSYWRRAAVDKPEWTGLSLERFSRRYAANSALAMTWAQRRPDAVRLVRYEQLVGDPAVVIESLCTFAGCEFDPAGLETPEHKGVQIDPLLWEAPVSQTKRWRDFMTEEQAATVERELADVVDALHHEHYTGAPA